MPNLIDQMNALKGLSDQQLGAELQQPSGAVPPYLVVSELSRRKDMRQRYAGQEAQRRPQTTVAQDQLSAIAPMPPMGAPPGAAPGMPMAPGVPPGAMGIASAPPMGAPPAGPTGYARGGIVGYADGGTVDLQMPPGSPSMDYGIAMPVDSVASPALADDGSLMGAVPDSGTAAAIDAQTSAPLDPGYAGIAARVEQQLQQEAQDRARAPWLGLLQGGLAVAGGTSPNALTNIGAGAQTGVDAYKAAIQGADSGTTTDLNNLASLQAATQDYNFKKQAAALEQAKYAASMDPNSPQNTPPLLRSIQQVSAMPDGPEKDAAMAMIQPQAIQAMQLKQNNAAAIGDKVVSGDFDPNMQGMYSAKPQIMSYIAKTYPDFNLAQAQQQWQAAVRNTASLNAPQQLRLRQNIGELTGQNGQPGMLDQLQAVADDWNAGGFGPLNGVTLTAALAGGLGSDAQVKAAKFEAQLAEVAPALSSVFSGGNSPTDKALANAQNVFNDKTSRITFDQLAQQARLNLKYRAQALDQAPAGPAGNRYSFGPNGATAGTPAPAVAPDVGAAAATVPAPVVDYQTYFGAQ